MGSPFKRSKKERRRGRKIAESVEVAAFLERDLPADEWSHTLALEPHEMELV